ncbi:MAG TPA: amidohydrolase family protein [Xanthobacteraceae bacterium]|nr:amidohydrolase family protein [Xanthobacteraceae bacterium]
MQGKVALEEHVAIEETASNFGTPFPDRVWQELKSRLTDVQDRRLKEMDAHGIELMLLSLNAPAIQAIPDPVKAEQTARKANDFLAEHVRKRPDRFQAFAALPMQDPARAARELERCVKQLGFRGALVNGFSQVGDADTSVYYDQPQYRPFWALVERLDVPFYLHPRNPLPRDARIYEGHAWLLGPVWGFGQETAVHALRLMGSGLFDEHPRLQIVLGHLGENLPYGLWRVDNANGWVPNRNPYAAKRPIRDYFRANFNLTTSGNFHTPSLVAAIAEIGADRVMFSVDWPFENVDHATNWFDACPIDENDRLKIGRTNALRLFKLGAK